VFGFDFTVGLLFSLGLSPEHAIGLP
jgi:hypothetical protein